MYNIKYSKYQFLQSEFMEFNKSNMMIAHCSLLYVIMLNLSKFFAHCLLKFNSLMLPCAVSKWHLKISTRPTVLQCQAPLSTGF